MRGEVSAPIYTDATDQYGRPRIFADERGSKPRLSVFVFLSVFYLCDPRSVASGDIDLAEAQAVEEGGYGGAGVFAGSIEDAVGEGGLLKLLLGLGAGVGLEVLVYGDEEAGGAGVDAGVLVVERGDEELRGGQGDVDGAGTVLLVDADVFGLELAEVDARDGLAMDDEEDAVSGEQIGEDETGFGAFNDGIDGVDDGLETVETLDALDDRRDRGVVGGGAAGDAVRDVGEHAGGGVAQEDGKSHSAEDEREDEGDEGSGGATTRGILGCHLFGRKPLLRVCNTKLILNQLGWTSRGMGVLPSAVTGGCPTFTM